MYGCGEQAIAFGVVGNRRQYGGKRITERLTAAGFFKPAARRHELIQCAGRRAEGEVRHPDIAGGRLGHPGAKRRVYCPARSNAPSNTAIATTQLPNARKAMTGTAATCRCNQMIVAMQTTMKT
jgi:hypothetical protein